MSYAFNLTMIIVTNVVNWLLSEGLDVLTEMERHKSKTDRMSSLIIKNVIAKFLNTTVIYFILYQMNPTNLVSKDGLV